MALSFFRKRREKMGYEINIPKSSLQPNSVASRGPTEDIPTEPVKETPTKKISGGASLKKQTIVSQVFTNLINQDIGSIRDYIIDEIITPSIRAAILDTISDVANALFGDTRLTQRTINTIGKSSIDYHGISNKNSKKGGTVTKSTGRKLTPKEKVRMVFLDEEADAQLLLFELKDRLNRYDEATVLDMLTIAKLSNEIELEGEFSDEHWGWRNLDGVRVAGSRRRKYYLTVPDPICLD